jgi:hypothetical protein
VCPPFVQRRNRPVRVAFEPAPEFLHATALKSKSAAAFRRHRGPDASEKNSGDSAAYASAMRNFAINARQKPRTNDGLRSWSCGHVAVLHHRVDVFCHSPFRSGIARVPWRVTFSTKKAFPLSFTSRGAGPHLHPAVNPECMKPSNRRPLADLSSTQATCSISACAAFSGSLDRYVASEFSVSSCPEQRMQIRVEPQDAAVASVFIGRQRQRNGGNLKPAPPSARIRLSEFSPANCLQVRRSN